VLKAGIVAVAKVHNKNRCSLQWERLSAICHIQDPRFGLIRSKIFARSGFSWKRADYENEIWLAISDL
jgi:hypothetical protein